VRSFTSNAVTPEQVQTVIDAAAMAPSARNLQPWQFNVYLDAKEIDELGSKIKDWLCKLPIDEPFASPMYKVLSDPDYRVFYGAPALILVIATDAMMQSVQDCGLAAENLLLAARALELGSAWVGTATPWFHREETKRMLKLAGPSTVVAPIVLGHPTSWPTAPERRTPDVHWCSLPKS
jgi:nitroreductase